MSLSSLARVNCPLVCRRNCAPSEPLFTRSARLICQVRKTTLQLGYPRTSYRSNPRSIHHFPEVILVRASKLIGLIPLLLPTKGKSGKRQT
jgi:hypothetical protein